MISSSCKFNQYRSFIASLPDQEHFRQEAILGPVTRLAEDEKVAVFYAPHNEYINTEAEILIVGICPGWRQTEMAYRSVRQSMTQGVVAEEEILKRANRDSRLYGTTRRNMIAMLDEVDIGENLPIASAEGLFQEGASLLHTTSMIKYPVFVSDGEDWKNYTGYSPAFSSMTLLEPYLENFQQDLSNLTRLRMIIPLGKVVEDTLLARCPIYQEIIIRHFPHPSGANGNRKKSFEAHKQKIQEQMRGLLK